MSGKSGKKKKRFGGSEIRSEIQIALQSFIRAQTNVPSPGAIAAEPRHQPWNPHIDANGKLCVLGASCQQGSVWHLLQVTSSFWIVWCVYLTEPGHLPAPYRVQESMFVTSRLGKQEPISWEIL